jgi:hypothetical protein
VYGQTDTDILIDAQMSTYLKHRDTTSSVSLYRREICSFTQIEDHTDGVPEKNAVRISGPKKKELPGERK